MAIDVGALQRMHPSWNIVDAIAAPNGGIWAVGRDGGVFSLNATGGTDGTVAPFHGSYTQLDPAARQGDRYFTKIQADPNTGGYTLVSNLAGQNYTFQGTARIDQPSTAPVAEPTKAIDFKDSDLADLEASLKSLGLGDLVNRAWGYYKDPQGGAGDAAATLRWVETTPEYANQFPGLNELKEQGRAWTPAQWSEYYNRMQETAVTYGLPAGMIDRADIGKMITGNVSPQEAIGRIEAAGKSMLNADPAVTAKMRQLGFTDGDLTAFYLDPDRAEPLLVRKEKELQARISVAGQRAGYDIDLGETETLRQWGVDEAEAQQGFSTLADLHPLFANTAGETMIGEGITEAEQLGATFGENAAARREIETRQKRRTAQFQGGGGAAGGSTGKTGLG